MRKANVLVASTVALGLMLVAGSAFAATQVNNPDDYLINGTSGVMYTSSYSGLTISGMLGADVIDWNINADGSVAFHSSAFPTVATGLMIAGNPVYVRLIVESDNTTTPTDYFYDPSHDIDYHLEVHLLYTCQAWTGTNCHTHTFDLDLSTTGSLTVPGSPTQYGSAYNTTTGAYTVIGGGNIDYITSSATCGGNGNTNLINSWMVGAMTMALGQTAINPQLLVPH